MGTFIRIVLSFATVGLLLWLFARASRGRLGDLLSGSIKGVKTEPISIVDRRQLTRNNAVAIVRAGSRHLLVGIGDSGVQLLAEGDDLVADHDETSSDGPEANTQEDRLLADGHDPTGTDIDPPPDTTLSLSTQTSPHVIASAWTRLSRPKPATPPRTNVIEALRTRTVRRS